ncbi:hypothetical protein ACWDHW_03900 [Streptomyces melanosporofaciens]|uniref:hypothetical protein n=1 Tax=unclassified Streptomyces TaxID=2593676 RepID=UPI00369FEE28
MRDPVASTRSRFRSISAETGRWYYAVPGVRNRGYGNAGTVVRGVSRGVLVQIPLAIEVANDDLSAFGGHGGVAAALTAATASDQGDLPVENTHSQTSSSVAFLAA